MNSSFENLEVWKLAMKLCAEVYELFKTNKDYSLKDQIQRASASVPANIAEGVERQTTKETVQFLYIAKGSSAETQTFLYLAIKLNYIPKKKGIELIDLYKKTSSMLYRLINTRKENDQLRPKAAEGSR